MSETRIPLKEFFGSRPLGSASAGGSVRHAWCTAEVIGADGTRSWIERTTADIYLNELFSLLNGLLGDLDREQYWYEADEAQPFPPVVPKSQADVVGQVSVSTLLASYPGAFFPPADNDRLTGRFVMILLREAVDEQDEDASVVVQGLGDHELAGVLRIAQLRFTESYSWDDAEPEVTVQVDPPAMTTVGQLMPGWNGPAIGDEVSLHEACLILEVQDSTDDIAWHIRLTPQADEFRMAGLLAWQIASQEEWIVSTWDGPDERPVGAHSLMVAADEASTAAPADPGISGTTEDDGEPVATAPLDPRLAALTCRSLPPGSSALRCVLLAVGLTAQGERWIEFGELSPPDWPRGQEVFGGYEWLGTLRSALRALVA